MKTIVIKLGGSVLVDESSYSAYARLLRDRLREDPSARLVVVVSARFGETDALLSLARSMAGKPDAAIVDLLWSTGEIKSAALLALALQDAGVRAVALDVHQAGIRRTRELDVDATPLRRALRRHEVVVVPGFLAAGRGGVVVSLGRGGSDLTAVAVAAAIGADRCELLKDVPGYFTADPHHVPDAAHIPEIDYARALKMAEEGCDLVQVAALETAQRAGLKLVIRSAHDPRETIVASGQTGVGPGSDRGRTGVGPGSERGQTRVRAASRSDSTFWDELRAENAPFTRDRRA